MLTLSCSVLCTTISDSEGSGIQSDKNSRYSPCTCNTKVQHKKDQKSKQVRDHDNVTTCRTHTHGHYFYFSLITSTTSDHWLNTSTQFNRTFTVPVPHIVKSRVGHDLRPWITAPPIRLTHLVASILSFAEYNPRPASTTSNVRGHY